MASHVVVIDTSFRRAQIKVNPGTYMTDIVDEACKKLGIKSSNYGLKNNNKPVDLSRTFRQTGLSSGAKLELVVASRSPSVVSVALQVPESLAGSIPGGRLIDKFSSDTTLWLVLRKFESKEGQNLNFTARGVTQLESGGTSGAGRIFFEMPALNIMGRDFSDFGGLQKNLAQIGINGGSIAMRLTFKTTDQPLEEAMKEIGEYFKEETGPESSEASKTDDSLTVENITDVIARLSSPQASEDVEMTTTDSLAVTNTDPAPLQDQTEPTSPSLKRPAPDSLSESSPQKSILGPDQRPIEVFSAPSGQVPKAALRPHNEADFEPTVAHAKLHQSRLQESSINKRLPSDAEQERLEAERAAKLAKKTEVNIKIRFPDEQTTVSRFTAEETGNDLYKYVTDLITAEDQPFKLVYNHKGPQSVPRSEKKLIRDLGFEGGVLVNFNWEDAASDEARKGSVLKMQYVKAAKEITVPEAALSEVKEEAGPSGVDKGNGKETGSGGGKSKDGMPKWFKGLGKK